MLLIRKISFIACAVLILLSSCSSSQHASRKRRKQAPCDCPKFNYVPQKDNVYKSYAFGMVDGTYVTNA